MHRLGVRLTEEEFKQLQELAKDEDRSFNWIVRDALRQKHNARKPKRSYIKRAVKESV